MRATKPRLIELGDSRKDGTISQPEAKPGGRKQRAPNPQIPNTVMSKLPEGQVYIPCSRIGYPKLWKPEGIKNDPTSKPRYGCAIYLSKDDEATKAKIDQEIARLSKIHFKGVKPKAKDLPVRDGDGEDGDENTKGCWVISANRAEAQGRPQIVDRNKKPIDSSDASEVYAGCYCDFIVSFYKPQNWGKICVSLEVVRKNKDGEPFGAARIDVDSVLPDLEDEEEFEA